MLYYKVILFNAAKDLTPNNSESFLVTEGKYHALLSDSITGLIGKCGKWNIISKHSFNQNSILFGDMTFLILTLKKIPCDIKIYSGDPVNEYLERDTTKF